MSLRHIGNGVTLLLLLLCGLLIALIVRQWEGYPPTLPDLDLTSEDSDSTRDNTSRFLRNQHKTIQISKFSEILARPLFVEGRLPDEEEEVESGVVQQVGQPKLKLEGVVLSPESRVAVVRDLTNNELIRLTVGMIHTGWRLTVVNDIEAVFERNDETFTLSLELISKPNVKASTSRFRLPSNQTAPPPRGRMDRTK